MPFFRLGEFVWSTICATVAKRLFFAGGSSMVELLEKRSKTASKVLVGEYLQNSCAPLSHKHFTNKSNRFSWTNDSGTLMKYARLACSSSRANSVTDWFGLGLKTKCYGLVPMKHAAWSACRDVWSVMEKWSGCRFLAGFHKLLLRLPLVVGLTGNISPQWSNQFVLRFQTASCKRENRCSHQKLLRWITRGIYSSHGWILWRLDSLLMVCPMLLLTAKSSVVAPAVVGVAIAVVEGVWTDFRSSVCLTLHSGTLLQFPVLDWSHFGWYFHCSCCLQVEGDLFPARIRHFRFVHSFVGLAVEVVERALAAVVPGEYVPFQYHHPNRCRWPIRFTCKSTWTLDRNGSHCCSLVVGTLTSTLPTTSLARATCSRPVNVVFFYFKRRIRCSERYSTIDGRLELDVGTADSQRTKIHDGTISQPENCLV